MTASDAILAGFICMCVIGLVVHFWTSLEEDWGVEMNEGQCAGHCKHGKCCTPWACHRGMQ